MMKTCENLSKLMFLMIFFLTCTNHDNEGILLEHTNWNEATVEFLASKCNLNFSTLKLGGEEIPVKLNEKVFKTMAEYIDYCLKHRLQLINYLKSREDFANINDIDIFERYDMNQIVYVIQLNNKLLLNSSFLNDTLQINSEEILEQPSSLFVEKIDTEIDCFSAHESIPQTFLIFSKLTQDGIKPIKISLFD